MKELLLPAGAPTGKITSMILVMGGSLPPGIRLLPLAVGSPTLMDSIGAPILVGANYCVLWKVPCYSYVCIGAYTQLSLTIDCTLQIAVARHTLEHKKSCNKSSLFIILICCLLRCAAVYSSFV